MCLKHFREISHRFCIMSLDLFSRKNSLRNANENFSIFRETFCSLQTLIKSIGETHKKKHFSSLKNDFIFHILIRFRFQRYLCKSDITIIARRVTWYYAYSPFKGTAKQFEIRGNHCKNRQKKVKSMLHHRLCDLVVPLAWILRLSIINTKLFGDIA